MKDAFFSQNQIKRFLLNQQKSLHLFIAGVANLRRMRHVAHWTVSGGTLQLGKIFQTKNVPQFTSSYIRGGQPVADCTLISSDDLFFRDQLGFTMKF